MQRLQALCCSVVLVALFVPPACAQQSATVTGTVTDAAEGFPLYGANVVVLGSDGTGMVAGAATDEEGEYVIEDIPPGSYVLEFRFVGYSEEQVPITLNAGETASVDASLEPTGFDLNTVVVTASRQAEKVLDAPASISVLGTEEIENDVVLSSAAVLRNTPGVDMAQTGVDRYEIVMRGFNNAFSGATYVLTDYRQGAIASLGVNAYQMMPITQIDLERVEVVRGPGSALYGAGVDAGVIHFITKDPFTYPGTTVSLGGGTREMFLASGRHAGVLGDRLGYKVVGNFSRAEDWHFDLDDPIDSAQVANFRPEALPVDYGNYKYNVNGSLIYRFQPNVTLTANGGFASSKSIFLSGIGTLQSDGFGYSYGQLRLDAGSLFAQAYVNANDAGQSFVYGDGAVAEIVDNSILFNAQAQYDFRVLEDRLRLIVGSDYELTMPRTDRTITGRNEDDDSIQEIGAYAQGSASLTSQLDATLALRADFNNIVDEVQLSPRGALVYKPTAEHSIRATYNRAFSSPGTNSLFLDILAGQSGGLTIRARGAADGFSFTTLPSGAYQASSVLPFIFGSESYPGGPPVTSEGLLLGPLYTAIYSEIVNSDEPVPGPLGDLPPEQLEQLLQLLSPDLTAVDGMVEGDIGYINLTTFKVEEFIDELTDIPPLQPTITQTFEVGYKGLIGGRLLLSVDGYYTNKKNFIGGPSIETPFVMVPAVQPGFEAALATGIAGNQPLIDALRDLQEDGVLPSGLPPEQVAAALIADLAAAQSTNLQALFAGQHTLSDTHSPVAIVQPLENDVPGQLLLSYRNYGDIDYFGVDVSTEFVVSDQLNVFANASWVSDNFFDASELDEAGTGLQLSLHAPIVKVKAGFDYAFLNGFRVNASMRRVGEFEVRQGPYDGTVDDYVLVDVGAGYSFDRTVPGLSLDVSVMNVFDNEHREYIGAPKLGRLAIARLTYNLD